MNLIQLSIKSADIDALRAAFPSDGLGAADSVPPPPGCEVLVTAGGSRPGIAAADILINVAISIGAGIPSGLVANWLFQRLQGVKAARIFDEDDELIVSIRELTKKIDETLSRDSTAD